jgi:hypothetical protein
MESVFNHFEFLLTGKQEHTLNKLKAYGELQNPSITLKRMGCLIY